VAAVLGEEAAHEADPALGVGWHELAEEDVELGPRVPQVRRVDDVQDGGEGAATRSALSLKRR
jgi:hypothetical protein